MKAIGRFFLSATSAGLLVLAPIYLLILLLLKAMQTVIGLVKPLGRLFPDWLPADSLLALLFVVVVCFLIGVLVRSTKGHAIRERIENSLAEKIPGYALVRGLTQQIAGKSQDDVWKPALEEIEEALVPAFIIETLADGQYTVFVPSVPTPLAGTVYILPAARVHPLDVPFSQALKVVTRWGSGANRLLASMKNPVR